MTSAQPCAECPSGSFADVLFWHAAISTWNETGDRTAIADGLRNQRPIPPFARDFIADLLTGKAQRKPVCKHADIARRNSFIRGNYKDLLRHAKQAKRDGKLHGITPGDWAKQEIANIYGLSLDSVVLILKKKG